MALIIDPDDLDQGAITTPTDAVWAAPTGREVAISSAGTLLPDLAANVYFEVRDHPDAENNGLYRVNEANPTTALITAFKISGVAPIVQAATNTVRIFATTATPKNVHFDTDARDVYLLEEGLLSSDGVTMQALYSFVKEEWKDDNDLIKHPFPLIAITPEQFEFIDDWNPFDAADIGPFTTPNGFDFTDGAGGNDTVENNDTVEDSWVINGFRVGDDVVVKNSATEPDFTFAILVISDGSGTDDVAEFATATLVGGTQTDDVTMLVRGAIRSRKLIRTGGWSEVTETGSVLDRQYAGVITLGNFEDNANDTAYFQQGNDPTDITAAVDFDFPGPVNESVLVYDDIGVDSGAGYDFTDASPDTIGTDGDFIVNGYLVGGQVRVRNANTAGNNGVYDITGVTASTLTVTATGGGDAGITTDADDTAAELSVDNRNAFAPRVRVRDADTNGKTFGDSNLAAIGVSGDAGFDNKLFRFPLSNATDLKISATDAVIAGTPWSEVRLRYLDEAYNRAVDSATLRNFGIVIDVGTYSQANGVTAGSTLVTSAGFSLGAGEALADYAGGSLIIHDATAPDRATHTISGTPVDNAGTLEITLTGALTNSESSISFTMERATPLTADAEEIYEKVQLQLRQDADIDDTLNVVTGRTADELLTFIGNDLNAGETDTSLPSNPNGGGTGVIIEGFDSNDTNRLFFFDNGGVSRNFPFVAAGTITFNDNAQADTGPAVFTMFFEFTERFTNTGFGISAVTLDQGTLDSSVTDLVAELSNGDFIRLAGFTNDTNNGIFVLTGAPAGGGPWTAAVRKIDGETLVVEGAGPSVSLDKNPIDSDDAIIVDDNGATPITGTVSGPSVAFDFDYDNNTQGDRTAGDDAEIVIRVIGTDVAAFVETFGTITRATGLSFSVVAPLERNFSNP